MYKQKRLANARHLESLPKPICLLLDLPDELCLTKEEFLEIWNNPCLCLLDCVFQTIVICIETKFQNISPIYAHPTSLQIYCYHQPLDGELKWYVLKGRILKLFVRKLNSALKYLFDRIEPNLSLEEKNTINIARNKILTMNILNENRDGQKLLEKFQKYYYYKISGS